MKVNKKESAERRMVEGVDDAIYELEVARYAAKSLNEQEVADGIEAALYIIKRLEVYGEGSA